MLANQDTDDLGTRPTARSILSKVVETIRFRPIRPPAVSLKSTKRLNGKYTLITRWAINRRSTSALLGGSPVSSLNNGLIYYVLFFQVSISKGTVVRGEFSRSHITAYYSLHNIIINYSTGGYAYVYMA